MKIQIIQNDHHLAAGSEFYGKYFIMSWMEECPEGMSPAEFVDRTLHDFDQIYLHKDGVWRLSTCLDNGDYTGYYASQEEAEDFVKSKYPNYGEIYSDE